MVESLFERYVPQAPLSRYIAYLWYFRGGEFGHRQELIMPKGYAELLINLDADELRVYEHKNPACFERLSGVILSGIYSRPMVIDTASQREIMGVTFQPAGAFPFVSVPMEALHNLDMPLRVLWGSDACALREELLSMSTTRARFQRLEEALLARLWRTEEQQHPAIRYASERFLLQCEHPKVALLEQETGLTARHINRLFRKQIGVAPKRFFRLCRFQRVLAEFSDQKGHSLADVSYTCGYTDQSHLTHEFQEFAGMTPSRYLEIHKPHGNHVPLSSSS